MKSNAEHRRHNGRPRTIGQLCCSIARKGVRYLRRCRTAGDDPDAKPVCGTPRTERHAAAVVALRCYFRRVDDHGKHDHEVERAPFRLGEWALGKRVRERSEASAARLAVSAISPKEVLTTV